MFIVIYDYYTITVLPERTTPGGGEIKSFRSPMSLPSFSSTNLSPCRYLSSVLWNYPRLTAPRDLQIPTSDSQGCHSMKVSNKCQLSCQQRSFSLPTTVYIIWLFGKTILSNVRSKMRKCYRQRIAVEVTLIYR